MPEQGPAAADPEIRVLEVGPFQADCYLVADPGTKETVVIDPGAEGAAILGAIEEAGLRVVAIVNTHGHVDHVGADNAIRKATGAPVVIHKDDAALLRDPDRSLSALVPGDDGGPPAVDREVTEGDRVAFGGMSLEVRHTPGHTPGGMTLVLGREPAAATILFAGDTLFAGSVGRTDFPGGDWATLEDSIRRVIYAYPDRTLVLPGHGPATTVGEERRGNPFVRG